MLFNKESVFKMGTNQTRMEIKQIKLNEEEEKLTGPSLIDFSLFCKHPCYNQVELFKWKYMNPYN